MIYIFDQDDNLLTSLSNDSDETCPYDSPYIDDLLNEVPEFEFTVSTNHPDSRHVKNENQVAVQDIDGVWRLFVIKELNETLEDITAISISGMNELIETFIEDKRPQDTTAEFALTSGLERSRYEPGTVAELGLNSTNFYRISAAKAVEKIINTWGGEVRDRVEFDEIGITGRYIDILERRGADTGHRFEVGMDIESVEVTIQSYPITALYGYGKSQETENDGYTRRINFADVEWKVANGDPVDKPLGQTWVGDPGALEKWGRLKDGQRIHREGKFEESEEEDPINLLEKTWIKLQESTDPNINFKMNVITLENISGYEHKKVRLGDTTHAFIEELDIVSEQRVIRHRYNIDDFSDAEVELGDPILTDNESGRLEQVESKLTEKEGLWDQATDTTVTDDSFSDTVPPVPDNFIAAGSFKLIMLSWDYDPSSYIAAYEIYASQVQGFTPDSSNLVWRGKSGGYNHRADVNEQWYFKIRAVNTHGTTSDFGAEISAQTLQINADKEVAPLTITNQLIAENAAIDFAKIANVEITNAMIVSLKADKIEGGDFSGKTFTGGTFQGATYETTGNAGTVAIQNGTITQVNADASETLKFSNGRLATEYTDGRRADMYYNFVGVENPNIGGANDAGGRRGDLNATSLNFGDAMIGHSGIASKADSEGNYSLLEIFNSRGPINVTADLIAEKIVATGNIHSDKDITAYYGWITGDVLDATSTLYTGEIKANLTTLKISTHANTRIYSEMINQTDGNEVLGVYSLDGSWQALRVEHNGLISTQNHKLHLANGYGSYNGILMEVNGNNLLMNGQHNVTVVEKGSNSNGVYVIYSNGLAIASNEINLSVDLGQGDISQVYAINMPIIFDSLIQKDVVADVFINGTSANSAVSVLYFGNPYSSSYLRSTSDWRFRLKLEYMSSGRANSGRALCTAIGWVDPTIYI